MSDTATDITTANDALSLASTESKILTYARAQIIAADKFYRKNLDPDSGPHSDIFVKFASLAATAIVEDTLHDAAAVSTDGVTITAGLVGLDVAITDLLKQRSMAGLEEQVIAEMGRAVADKFDTDVLALASGFSSEVGSTGVDMTIANFLAAIATLEAANAQHGNLGEEGSFGPTPEGMQGLMAFLAPVQMSDLRTAMSTTSASFFAASPEAAQVLYSNGTAPRGFVGALFGVPIFVSGNVAADSTTDRLGFMAVPSAIGVLVKYLARYETERDLGKRNTRHALTSFYGAAEIVDGYGCLIRTDF